MIKFLLRYSLCCLFLLPSALSADRPGDTLKNILSDIVPSADRILDPEDAFNVSIKQYADRQIILNWDIETGYYLYKDKFKIHTDDPGIKLIDTVFPAGELKADPVFGTVEVYYGQNNIIVPFNAGSVIDREAIINLAYQGCKEGAVCYPPITKQIPVSLKTAAVRGRRDVTEHRSEQDAITRKLKHENLLINIIAFFGFGFLLALTPCVFPMIPVLSGIIVGDGERITRTRAISLSISYVMAMALTYALLGVIAGLFHLNLQAAAQNVWVLSLFSGVFVLLALSMFGFYELRLPSNWQGKLFSDQDRAERGTLKGAALMGALSALIVGPCVAPPLAGALLYISQTGHALLGGFALFAMGLGFGVPLLVVGATSGELLPRAGAWMEVIKRIFGVIMLGVAVWFLERVIPPAISLILWALLFIIPAVFIGALDRIDHTTTNWQRLWKGVGLAMLVYGTVLIVASVNGGGTFFKSVNNTSTVTRKAPPFTTVSGIDELNAQLEQARIDGKPVLLDFYADWCVVCDELERYTYADEEVQKNLAGFTLIKADVTDNNETDRALLKHFDLFGPPAILFFNTDAVEIKSHRLVGFIDAEQFVRHVRHLAL